MKARKLTAFLTATAMLFLQGISVYAEENSTIHLYEGEAYAEAWTCPLTLAVSDRSIYAEGNTIAIRCEAETAPYFVLTSNSGGES